LLVLSAVGHSKQSATNPVAYSLLFYINRPIHVGYMLLKLVGQLAK